MRRRRKKLSGSLQYLGDEPERRSGRMAGDQPGVETQPCAGAGLQFDSAASCLLERWRDER